MNVWYLGEGRNTIMSEEVGKVNVPWCVLWTLLHMDFSRASVVIFFGI